MNNFQLLCAPITLSVRPLKFGLMSCTAFFTFFILGQTILRLVEVVERDLPDAGEENLRAVADLRYPTGQITAFFTRL